MQYSFNVLNDSETGIQRTEQANELYKHFYYGLRSRIEEIQSNRTDPETIQSSHVPDQVQMCSSLTLYKAVPTILTFSEAGIVLLLSFSASHVQEDQDILSLHESCCARRLKLTNCVQSRAQQLITITI